MSLHARILTAAELAQLGGDIEAGRTVDREGMRALLATAEAGQRAKRELLALRRCFAADYPDDDDDETATA